MPQNDRSDQRELFEELEDPKDLKRDGNVECSGKSKALRRGIREWAALWGFEVLASVLSICCVIGIIAFLSAIQGRPYGAWRVFNMHITPNSLLAILSTMSKTSCLFAVAEALGQLKWRYFSRCAHRLFDLELFDRASRGPWGSLRLISTIKTRTSFALAGALIMVFAIALEPFTQQILSFPTATMSSTEEGATMSAAQGFGAFEPVLEDEYLIDLNRALLAGTIGVKNQPGYNCPSAQCHWPSFSTLGVCSQCGDVSRDLVSECEFFGETKPATQKCSYRFPRSMNVPDMSAFVTSIMWTKEPFTEFYASLAMNNSVTVSENLPHIAVVESIQFSDHMYHGNYSESNFQEFTAAITPIALQCELLWCCRHHAETSVENGLLNDPTTSVTDLRVGHVIDELSGFAGSPLWPAGHAQPSVSSMNLADWQSDRATNVFWINHATSRGLGMAIRSLFGTTMRDMKPLRSRTPIDVQRSPLQIRISSGDLTQILDDVAVSVTNKIRQTSFTRRISGVAEKDVTIVRVNWYWLIYPVTLVASACVFLSYCISLSNESCGVVWKSSVLPLLLRGNGGYEEQAMLSNRLSDIECEAKELRVRLSGKNNDARILRWVDGGSVLNTDDET